MSDLNRGIMKFKGADTPKAVTISTVLLLGSIALLIFWALQVAYAVNQETSYSRNITGNVLRMC